VGARVKTESSFASQFRGLSLVEPVKLKSEGGKIDALSGATVSSRGVVAGVAVASDVYKRLKPEIVEKTKSLKKL